MIGRTSIIPRGPERQETTEREHVAPFTPMESAYILSASCDALSRTKETCVRSHFMSSSSETKRGFITSIVAYSTKAASSENMERRRLLIKIDEIRHTFSSWILSSLLGVLEDARTMVKMERIQEEGPALNAASGAYLLHFAVD